MTYETIKKELNEKKTDLNLTKIRFLTMEVFNEIFRNMT